MDDSPLENADQLVGVPSTVPDGTYLATVTDVFSNATAEETKRTAKLDIEIQERASSPETIEVLLLVKEIDIDEPVTCGMRLHITTLDDEVTDITVALGETIQASAATLPADQYAVPLKWNGITVGETQLAPHVQPLHRNHSILVSGEPGAGKTEFIKLLLPQLETQPDEPVVVFNFKNDYTDWAEDETDREVIRISLDDSTDFWNIFREVTDEETFEQLGQRLFKQAELEARNPFFPRTARQLLVAIMKYLRREGSRSGLAADNRELLDFLARFGKREVHELLDQERHADLRSAISAIDPEAAKQAAGVYSTMQSIAREVLTGDFAMANGEFSIREYMANPDGRLLLLDYPIAQGDRMAPIYKLFIDRAIQLAIDTPDRGAYFILDEFARIPHLELLDALVATGRAQNTQAILGVQSLSQLAQHYEDATVDALLSGFTQEVHLRSGDKRTVDYVRDRLGISDQITWTFSREGAEDGERVNTTVEETPLTGQLQRLDDGEAIIYATKGWVHATLPMWRELDQATKQALVQRSEEKTARSLQGDD